MAQAQAGSLHSRTLRPLAGAASCELPQAILGALRLMAKLDRDAAQGRVVFAPLIFRLALKLEQVPWTEFSSSASEAMYVLRSAQRLFKLDAVCTWLDTWLEAEAIAMTIPRCDLGACMARPDADALPPVETAMPSPPIPPPPQLSPRLSPD